MRKLLFILIALVLLALAIGPPVGLANPPNDVLALVMLAIGTIAACLATGPAFTSYDGLRKLALFPTIVLLILAAIAGFVNSAVLITTFLIIGGIALATAIIWMSYLNHPYRFAGLMLAPPATNYFWLRSLIENATNRHQGARRILAASINEVNLELNRFTTGTTPTHLLHLFGATA